MTLYSAFYRQIREGARAAFPSLTEIPDVTWDHLVSPYSIELPTVLLERVQAAISAFYQLSRRESYRKHLGLDAQIPHPISNDSILMAYDFHTDESGNAHLIEINTNASGFLICALMDCAHSGQDVLTSPMLAELRGSVESEIDARTKTPNIAIIDDDVLNQKMYAEFVMYRDLFDRWGWPAVIGEAADLQLQNDNLMLQKSKIDFVYNRSTDFYFSEPEHQSLRAAWESGAAIVSPQPREYFLLADKQRLIEFGRAGWLESAGATASETAALRAVLIPSGDKKDFGTVEELWEQRKSLFFKPKRSHGGKSVYRGSSVSRKVFDRLMEEDTLIQRFVPAARHPDESMANWKFDVRFFVYRDRVQQVAARIYQGQVTNFSSPLGGFTKVRFV
jgi:hypothetical protein